jgi:hypothetical protein
MEGDKRTATTELGFPEDKREDGNIEIDVRHSQKPYIRISGKRLHALQNGRGVILRAGPIASKINRECFFVDVTGDLEDASQFGREVIEHFDADLGLLCPGMPASRDHRKQVYSVHPPTAV